MKRRLIGVSFFCLVLFAAILAGYWGLLDAEKLRGGEQSAAIGEAATSPDKTAASTSETAVSPAASGSVGDGMASAGSVPSVPAAPSQTEARLAPAVPATDVAPATAGTSTNANAQAAATNAAPTFDILRVEPDGSTVLAGRAPPNSTVRLLDGAAEIASETADASGSFVVVLDGRLSVGEHAIRIEAKRRDGLSVTSQEIAIINIPEKGREGDLLAMVEKPGEASRLISMPKIDVAAALSPAPTQPQAPNSAESVVAGATDPGTPDVKPAAPPPRVSQLGVEAVEIEDDTVYVAGRAPDGVRVRVYVDDRLLGEDRRLAANRFLVTSKAVVITGEHIVRADAIGPDGEVVARVEVPFSRPDGRSMSALSPATVDAASRTPSAALSGAASAQSGPERAAMGGTAGSGELAALGDGQGGVDATLQPALEAAKARVIIRRGDTLWRISRDAYGDGARYTTIYLANGDQIRNPDRIYPGQVFRMPKDETDPAVSSQ